MSLIEERLDQILLPRPGGSENLEATADLLKRVLAENGAITGEQLFTATPHGFALMWSFALLMLLFYGVALRRGHLLLVLCIPVVLAVVLFLEFEKQISTVSLLWPATERNIIGTWPGLSDRVMVFTAHYDTTTHFGDHFSWGLWGKLQGPATGVLIALPLLAFWLRRKQQRLPAWVSITTTLLAALPFAAMFWFQTIGPLVRTPSVGAIDNGASVVALMSLADAMKSSDAMSRPTVKIVFLAAEEERTLGSRAYAQALKREYAGNQASVHIINLESVATTDKLAYVPEDGFATTRYRTSDKMIAEVNQYAVPALEYALPAKPLPFGTLTDGRSFLAEGFETLTLRSLERDEFPHDLHSLHDSRDRISVDGILNTVRLLEALAQASAAN